LTSDQAAVARPLPRIPIKEIDLRRQNFEDRHGEGAVELDALEALYPGALAALVREAIVPYRDDTLPVRLRTAEGEAHDAAVEAWDVHTAEVRETLSSVRQEIEAVLARYQARLEALDAELQAELAPFQERIATLRQAVEKLQESFHPELPDRPEPETEEPDEDGWLLDTRAIT
jgi:hypothetical protein